MLLTYNSSWAQVSIFWIRLLPPRHPVTPSTLSDVLLRALDMYMNVERGQGKFITYLNIQ